MNRLRHTFSTLHTGLILLVVALHGASANAQPLRVLNGGAFKQVVPRVEVGRADGHGRRHLRHGPAAAAASASICRL